MATGKVISFDVNIIGVLDKPNQPINCTFPKRDFGKQKRSFQAQWFQRWKWLHYDNEKDRVFCFTCMDAIRRRQLLASNAERTFIEIGFTNWKSACEKFSLHEGSKCHKDAVFRCETVPKVGDIGEMLSSQHAKEKLKNRKCLLTILQNIQFLAKQGLPLRGHEADNSNFIQLLKLRENDIVQLRQWTEKKTDKYMSSDIQNEILKIMAMTVIRGITDSFSNGKAYYAVMCDESTDCANEEQMVICIRWVDDDLWAHEEFLGLYQLISTDANTIFCVIKDCLLRINLPINMCRGQCYDGARVFLGEVSGVAKKIADEEPRAVVLHCFGHVLSLSCSDAVKNSKLMADTLDITREITKIIKDSPKREGCFKKLKSDFEVKNAEHQSISQPQLSTPGIRVLCPTRWTVRGQAFDSVLENYCVLQETWRQSLQQTRDTETKARINGIASYMEKFDFLFGLKLSKLIFNHCDNLSRTLQSPLLTAAEGKDLAALTVKTLQSIRNDDNFKHFWENVLQVKNRYDIEEPSLPRKRKIPKKINFGICEPEFAKTSEDVYRGIYFEALDLVTNAIENRFDQPGYKMYAIVESLLVKAVKGEDFKKEFTEVVNSYGSDFDACSLQVQLDTLAMRNKELKETISIHYLIKWFREFKTSEKLFFSEVIKLLKLIIVMPATNATSERSFSSLRRIKSYLRSTMKQARLNHLMVLQVHKYRTESLDLLQIANEFVRGSEHRMSVFGLFQEHDLHPSK